MKRIKARERRYLMMAFVFSVVWGIGFARLRQSDVLPPRDSADALLQDAQPIAAFESVWVGQTAGLTGGLAFVEQRPYPYHRVAHLDVATGEVRTLFNIPDGALVYHIATTPDPDILLMTYSPAKARYLRSGLYTVSLSTGVLTHLLGDETDGVYYAQPQWNQSVISYAVYERDTQARRVEQFNPETGQIMVIAEDAVMPLTSADGQTMVYVRVNSSTGARSLWQTDKSGAAQAIIQEGDFADIDVPVLSPDGSWVYFTVLEGESTTSRLLEVVFGASRASAHGNHNVPMRWYRVGMKGEGVQPVTTNPFITLYGGLDAAETLSFVSDTGFYVAQDGRINQLIQSRVMRSFIWLPE